MTCWVLKASSKVRILLLQESVSQRITEHDTSPSLLVFNVNQKPHLTCSKQGDPGKSIEEGEGAQGKSKPNLFFTYKHLY